MYKIYINENALMLVDNQFVKDQKYPPGSLVAPYTKKTKMLLSYIDMLEKTNRIGCIVLHHEDKKALIDDFESLYRLVPAAGGLVKNSKGKYLFIYRKKHWDLPKGKIEKGESKKEAAAREIMEETGLKKVKIKKRIKVTRHSYKGTKHKRNMKITYWYAATAKKQPLNPQEVESIELAEWKSLDGEFLKKGPVFKNINEVIAAYKKKTLGPPLV